MIVGGWRRLGFSTIWVAGHSGGVSRYDMTCAWGSWFRAFGWAVCIRLFPAAWAASGYLACVVGVVLASIGSNLMVFDTVDRICLLSCARWFGWGCSVIRAGIWRCFVVDVGRWAVCGGFGVVLMEESCGRM